MRTDPPILSPNPDLIARFSQPHETWSAVCQRVASIAASPEDEAAYRRSLLAGELVPAGQILRGGGRAGQVLYNCYVIDSERTGTAHELAQTITDWTRRGIGVGIHLDTRKYTHKGEAFQAVKAIAQSQQRLWVDGVRRTATMVCLDADCNDLAPICAQLSQDPVFRHLNVAVLCTDRDMADYRRVSAIAALAWENGNPGVLFIDSIRRNDPFGSEISACNPCGEQHLGPDEGCNLASINLARLVKGNGVDFDRLGALTRLAVRFLDDAVDATDFPSQAALDKAMARRRIGIGVIGLATLLAQLGIDYGSPESLSLADRLAATMRQEADAESCRLGASRGVPVDNTISGRRNSHLLSIAPTGAISLLWQVSSGIEPYFFLDMRKETMTVRFGDAFPKPPPLALDIPWQRHVEMLSVWQRHVDGGISKTVNMPETTSVAQIARVLEEAWRTGCKGLTVFRDKSRTPALEACVARAGVCE